MINEDAVTLVALVALSPCIIGIVWAEIESEIRHRRRKRHAAAADDKQRL
ncbi:hypothetical protein K4A87_09140 [Xanthomonas fragariae]|nr:hypothetical protein [Xanthomonas fragariae]UKR53943.1 hypothetical protein K4A87_09075 [Xanthomonas fragariae]UKR53951.1 hypothetical protein K4A87_09140 [Xanthomonas fragariae]